MKSARCMAQLGWMLREGRGSPVNVPEAVKWFTQAAEAKNPDGMLSLAQILLDGEGGVPRDASKAVSLAEEALPLAEEEWITERGKESLDPAAPPTDTWVYGADEQSSAVADAHFILAVAQEHAGPAATSMAPRTTFQHYLTAARHGHVESMHAVGNMLDLGVGMLKDAATAQKWYHMAAEAGQVDSMYAIGLAHRSGRGAKHDNAKAMTWYMRAAEAGHARAWNKVGWMRQLGHGGAAPAAVLQAFAMGAKLGSTKAMCHLGALHRDGSLGLPENAAEARRWFKQAADAGCALGKAQLENMDKGVLPFVFAPAS